ncbi:MAG: transglutaminase family protein [Acidimicrobiales bacterium]
MTPAASHLRSLLNNPQVSLDQIAAAISVGVDRDAPPEFELLQVMDALAGAAPPANDAVDVMAYVFGELGFAPNASNYYSLSNSLLHRVLEYRRGNPISLAIVAIEIGKRLGVPLVPVGMPAHFLIGHASEPGTQLDRWFDPFAAGRELGVGDARDIFDAITPASSEFDVSMLGETPRPFVAGRILANIKNAAIRSGDIPSFIAASELVLGLPGSGVTEYRALVRALGSSGRHDRAVEVYQWLAESDPEHELEHRQAVIRHAAYRN